MAELDIPNPNALHIRLGGKGGHKSQLYRYLAGEADVGSDKLKDIFEALDLVIVAKWRVLR